MVFRGGAYASLLAVADDLLPVPEVISSEQAAALPLAGADRMAGLFEHGQLQAGETWC